MSDYARVTPIPDFLNISGWYELVDGDTIPNGWLAIALYPNGNTNIVQQTYGYQQARSVRSALKDGHRLFTRTPPPSAIKRIRAAETKQEELPEQTDQDPEPLRRRVSDLEVQLADLYSQLRELNERLNNYIDGA